LVALVAMKSSVRFLMLWIGEKTGNFDFGRSKEIPPELSVASGGIIIKDTL
jgi:hypothetical protein